MIAVFVFIIIVIFVIVVEWFIHKDGHGKL
jgi:hypothetical protein